MNLDVVVKYLKKVDELHRLFRGQCDAEWDLLPSISRVNKPWGNGSLSILDWQQLEEYLLENFQQQAKPYMNFEPEGKLEWLVQGQHHGLPTALLDWTTNPLKALYFAVDDPSMDTKDGAVFFCALDSYYTDTKHVGDIDKIECFHPSHINNRITAQEGCFTIHPLPKAFDPFMVLDETTGFDESGVCLLDKVIIPKTDKPKIRRQLIDLGITHQSLFPGLDGIAKGIVRSFHA